MGPATRYVVRSTGCSRFIGLVLIVVGLVVLVFNSGLGISWQYRRWWPVLIIAFGIYLLIRHYWLRLGNRSRAGQVFDAGVLPTLMGRGRRSRVPTGPLVIVVIGVCWLLINLLGPKPWVIWAIGLIALGALFLAGSLRATVART